MITSNIIQRVFLVSKDNDKGTAFTIEVENVQYLISARHVFDSLENNERTEITIFKNNEWQTIQVVSHLLDNQEIDIIVFSLENDLSPRHPIQIGAEGVTWGQDTYFLGFPYGMFVEDNNINNNFPFPFVKKATYSAGNNHPEEGQIAYLDGHTNKGFSGGPVVFIRQETGQLTILGVMKSYVVHEGEIEFEDINDDGEIEHDTFYYDENSGIIKVQVIQYALDIIHRIEE